MKPRGGEGQNGRLKCPLGFLVSNCLSDNVWNVDIIPSMKANHFAIIIEFKDIDDRVKGPGIWKLNCSLLSDQLYVEEINRLDERLFVCLTMESIRVVDRDVSTAILLVFIRR